MVVEPVVVKKAVEVALVLVEFCAVKFWSVVEPRVRILANVPRPLEVIAPPLALVKKRLVELAVVAKIEVEVAAVEVEVPIETNPRLALVEKRLVLDAVVAK